MAADGVDFDGPCPFLTCLAVSPHTHPICPDCGAVRYGNFFCPTCTAYCAAHSER